MCSSDLRLHRPAGAAGGEAGARGRTLLNGEELPPKATLALRAGDLIRVESPGGGGFGEPVEPS